MESCRCVQNPAPQNLPLFYLISFKGKGEQLGKIISKSKLLICDKINKELIFCLKKQIFILSISNKYLFDKTNGETLK